MPRMPSPDRSRRSPAGRRDVHRRPRAGGHVLACALEPRRPRPSSPESCWPRDDDREHFWAIFLNAQNGYLAGHHLVSTGSLSASIVHPREVLGPALREKARPT